MWKKAVLVLLCAVLFVGMAAACGNNNNAGGNTNTGGTAGGGTTGGGNAGGTTGDEPVDIYMFINMPEYTDAFNAFVEEYKKVKPNVNIELEIMQADYPTILKSKIAAGSLSDVFASTAGGEIDQYAEYSADLTNEPLAQAMNDAVKSNMTSSDGKVLGLPVKDNLFCLIYNKDLFEKAGIASPPKTMTELKDAIAKLEAIGVTPFANGYKEWWVQKHIFQHFINAAAPGNTKALVEDFIAGKTTFADHPELLTFFDFIDLTVEHGMPKPLERDLSAEISDFATGKAAMMTGQGAWVEEQVLKIDPNLNIGVAGYPVSENPEDAMIITGADQALRVNKDSPVVDEVIEFFNWLYTSDYSKTWFSEVAKVIPPVKDVPYPNLQMPQQMQQIMATEKTGELAIIYSLDSFHQRFGEIMQAYIASYLAGNASRDQAIKDIEAAWIQLGAPK